MLDVGVSLDIDLGKFVSDLISEYVSVSKGDSRPFKKDNKNKISIIIIIIIINNNNNS